MVIDKDNGNNRWHIYDKYLFIFEYKFKLYFSLIYKFKLLGYFNMAKPFVLIIWLILMGIIVYILNEPVNSENKNDQCDGPSVDHLTVYPVRWSFTAVPSKC